MENLPDDAKNELNDFWQQVEVIRRALATWPERAEAFRSEWERELSVNPNYPDAPEVVLRSFPTGVPFAPEPGAWLPDERERQAKVLHGEAVVANVKRDHRLIEWAKGNGKFFYIGGHEKTKWGNPFHLGRDGNRAQVCDKHATHLTTRPDLLHSLGELQGMVLACHCFPARCHGDELANRANQGAPEPGAG